MKKSIAAFAAVLIASLGVLTAAEIQSGLDKGEKVPVLIAITGYGQAEDRLRAQAAGFDYHFVKPVNLEDLLNLLSTLAQPD